MIYLIHENKEKNEVSLIYYVEPPKSIKYYKAINKEDLPVEKNGFYRKIFYNKTEDTVTAEYTPIPPTEEELLKDELEKTKLELSTAITELADMVLTEQMKNV